MKTLHRNSRVDIKIADQTGVPKTLVEHAKRLKAQAEAESRSQNDAFLAYNSVWCVFDIDDHPNVGDATQMARDNGIELAVSNPCIGLWLLLHFQDDPGMKHRTIVQRMLKKIVPGYDKSVEFSRYQDGCLDAERRASRLDQLAESVGEPGRNPTTGVYRLSALIRGGNLPA